MSNYYNYYNKYWSMLEEARQRVDHNHLEKFHNQLLEFVIKKMPILVCGNGGSAAIAEHLVCDHVKGVTNDTDLQPSLISLTTNTPLITAIANDYSYADIFAKQIEWYTPLHALLVVSSSGNSPNIIKAIQAAKTKNAFVMGLVGFDGGYVKEHADMCLHVPCDNYGVVEDCHMAIMHSMAQHIRLCYQANEFVPIQL